MNKENIHAVANAIEFHIIENLEFDMTTFGRKHECKTAGCMAAWAAAYAHGEIQRATDLVQADAQQFFGISDPVADELFHAKKAAEALGLDPIDFLVSIKRRHAVQVLRRLANEGEVNWLNKEEFPQATVYAY